MDTHDPKPAVDWVEVSREAHELTLRHGHNAHNFAAGLAKKAGAVGDLEGARFWEAVSSSLAPRG